jgi:hypothetical protein
MKKIFEAFLNLFFPDSDEEGEKNPFWLKVLVLVMIIFVVAIGFIILG